jgi:hypothetical protein
MQRSIVPAWAYRIIRRHQGSAPVMLTAKRAIVSSRQVAAHELCWDCEQLFRRIGEDWMSQQVCQGVEFPLLQRLNLALPDWELPSHTAYSGTACGLDTDKLIYFGASVLWRASLRRWTIGSTETTTVQLGPHQEALRKFLLGETPFPAYGVVVVNVCTDFASQGCFFPPCAIKGGVAEGYSFLILGVHYRFFLGPNVPNDMRLYCCVHSPGKRITVADHSQQSLHSYGHLFQTAKESRKHREPGNISQ